jgi:ferredoxin-NADP reductase
MKTCPWNLEGLLADRLWREVAMKVPGAAPWLAALDDRLGRGAINPVKTWWWDIELDKTSGRYVRAAQTHRRGLQRSLKLKVEDQALAVYPADVMPPPYPVVFPVNREEGLARYRALLTPAQYRQRLAAGLTEGLVPQAKRRTGEAPVFPVVLERRVDMAEGVARFEFAAADGGELPPFEPGAHVDVVIAPEYQRQFSLAGDPADRRTYVLGVLRELPPSQGGSGRGGSALMHRAFREGRRVFIGRPLNHFPLHEDAAHSWLFAGGIGVTPLIAMAHRLHALGRPFELHYSAAGRRSAGFIDDLARAPWANRVHLHLKDEGGRADLAALVPGWGPGQHLYTCGSPRYMDAVFAAAAAHGWPEDALHREYFSVPETPPWVNRAFRLKLAKTGGRVVDVPADQRATEALAAIGIHIETKCTDGLCGVCAVRYDAAASGEVEHRDHVLGRAERRERLLLCCSRAAEEGGLVVVDL